MLGKVMIASPLPLEEITGIFIMASFNTSPSVRLHVHLSGIMAFVWYADNGRMVLNI
jgi:hypothetical protein